MAGQNVTLGTLTIASGQTDSGALILDSGMFGFASTVVVYCPATLPETITVQIDPSNAPSGQTWYTVAPNEAPAAGKAVILSTGAFGALRLHAGGAVAADRVFVVCGQLDMAT